MQRIFGGIWPRSALVLCPEYSALSGTFRPLAQPLGRGIGRTSLVDLPLGSHLELSEISFVAAHDLTQGTR
jgi:hypothetical protein